MLTFLGRLRILDFLQFTVLLSSVVLSVKLFRPVFGKALFSECESPAVEAATLGTAVGTASPGSRKLRTLHKIKKSGSYFFFLHGGQHAITTTNLRARSDFLPFKSPSPRSCRYIISSYSFQADGRFERSADSKTRRVAEFAPE